MAYQHFYSRVPAKMSMYNRSDSFDTFVCSAALDREYIEKELFAICDDKPTSVEYAAIRRGEHAPIFFGFPTEQGDYAEGCISFIPSDYTGERSAYMVHTLVFREDKDALLSTVDKEAFYPDAFEQDIAQFDITADNASPISDYPEFVLEPKPAEDISWLTQFDAATVKRFLFAMLAAIAGKYKSVFFVLPNDQDGDQSLRLMRSMMQILPYHLRAKLSFATFADAPNRFPSVKLKGVSATAPDIPTSKGATVNFINKITLGIRDEDIAASVHTVDFFYRLIKDDTIRREFLLFADHAAKAQPALAALSLKNFDNLVYLFRVCCGFYAEKEVLPDDNAIIDFLSIYEKNRTALSDEYRMAALRCLQRYPAEHAVIPNKIFSKVTKIYHDEPIGVRRQIMNVMRELIHTDIMRDKLFTFMKNSFPKEDPDTKAALIDDFSRVFYGGFLQTQILTFFSGVISEESEESQEKIVEKILLAIRTTEIQPMILDFLDKKMDCFNDANKMRFFDAVLEHLPEGDDLAVRLLHMANDLLPTASDAIRDRFVGGLCNLLSSEQKKRKNQLISLLSAEKGACTEISIRRIFTELTDDPVFKVFVKALGNGSISDCIDRMAYVFSVVPDMSPATAETFRHEATTSLRNSAAESTLIPLLCAEKVVNIALIGKDDDAMPDFCKDDYKYVIKKPVINEATKQFGAELIDRIVRPNIHRTMYEIFSMTKVPDAPEQMVIYASRRPATQASPAFAAVSHVLELINCAVADDVTGILRHLDALPDIPELRTALMPYLRRKFIAEGESRIPLNQAAYITVRASHGYVKDRKFAFEAAYNEAIDALHSAPAKAGKRAQETAQFDGESEAMISILSIGNTILSGDFSDAMKEAVSSEGHRPHDVLGLYVRKYGKAGADRLRDELLKSGFSAEYCAAYNETVATLIPKTNIVGKLLSFLKK